MYRLQLTPVTHTHTHTRPSYLHSTEKWQNPQYDGGGNNSSRREEEEKRRRISLWKWSNGDMMVLLLR